VFRQKVAAGDAAVRRTGGSATLDSLNHYLKYAEMIIATSNYRNVIHGSAPGDVSKDGEGKQIMRLLGENVELPPLCLNIVNPGTTIAFQLNN
jgi:multimeric flavodoxin WrbA